MTLAILLIDFITSRYRSHLDQACPVTQAVI